jgi:hypothetical protein
MIVLPRAHQAWITLRFQDYKSVVAGSWQRTTLLYTGL